MLRFVHMPHVHIALGTLTLRRFALVRIANGLQGKIAENYVMVNRDARWG